MAEWKAKFMKGVASFKGGRFEEALAQFTEVRHTRSHSIISPMSLHADY